MILSSQSIRARCETATPMITPFVAEKRVVNGKSFGLSSASYDVRIAHDLTLGYMNDQRGGGLGHGVKHYSLAHTVEDFRMPLDVCATVLDKSSFARVFISCYNTFLDPGWHGNLTLEIVNLSNEPIFIPAESPICQIVFMQLDEPTEIGYSGKYLGQTKAAHPARYEEAK